MSQLPEQVQIIWFEFDHFYSDQLLGKTMEIVFSHHPIRLLDIRGYNGRWATLCVSDIIRIVEVTMLNPPLYDWQ
jgi:hypothetical protein